MNVFVIVYISCHIMLLIFISRTVYLKSIMATTKMKGTEVQTLGELRMRGITN